MAEVCAFKGVVYREAGDGIFLCSVPSAAGMFVFSKKEETAAWSDKWREYVCIQ